MKPKTKHQATTLVYFIMAVFFTIAATLVSCHQAPASSDYDTVDEVINRINQKHHFVCDTILVECDPLDTGHINLSAITSISHNGKPSDCEYLEVFNPIINHSEIPEP
jgi:hypothetical protein